MSGGYFDYGQYHINDIADNIEEVLDKQGKEMPKDELYCSEEYYEKYPEEQFYTIYPKEVQERMREAVRQLRIAAIYAQRVDWLLSGDDGEDSFLKRLESDLDEQTKDKEQ